MMDETYLAIFEDDTWGFYTMEELANVKDIETLKCLFSESEVDRAGNRAARIVTMASGE